MLFWLVFTVEPVHSVSTVLYVGFENTCQVTDGRISCWGSQYYGKLGTESTSDMMITNIPIDLGDFYVESADIAYKHICVLSPRGTVKCWGWADNGRLGYGNDNDIGRTAGSMANCVELDLGTNFTVSQISVGRGHTCALSLALHEIRCWGLNDYGTEGGMLGIGSTESIGDEDGMSV